VFGNLLFITTGIYMDVMKFDVLIIGGGPAGLAAAIRLRQLSQTISVAIIEKGSEIGAHILSGAVIETRALDELIPNWKEQGAPLYTSVSKDQFLFLSENKSWQVPHWFLPSQLKNHGNYIVSLANLCRWLATQALALGVEIFPGFAAAKILFDENNRVKGIATGEMGVAKNGMHKPEYAEAVELHAQYTLFAEGCRGSLSEQLIKHFQLRAGRDLQTYGIGIKEIWEINSELYQPGLVQHTAGWPLKNDVYGGSFIYHMEKNQIAVGFVIGLDYQNTYLDPFEEMQRFKLHPHIRPLFEGGRRIAYGARALNEGGLQAIPRLTFPGGALIGCGAGFLNVAKIKGSHNAMKSGMLAAEAIHRQDLDSYEKEIRHSWVFEELHTARNFRPFFRYGLKIGTLLGGIELKLWRGKTPWTLHYPKKDREFTLKADLCPKIEYPAHDGVVSFDRMSSVYLANIQYDENQPVHLHLRDPLKSIEISYQQYDAPEQRYCPAGVYEILKDEQGRPRLQINAANCVMCKTCDIKDPADNIVWTVPEGGSGPNYTDM
jgi:electron-transferring-flavoprotein dehydrogenase